MNLKCEKILEGTPAGSWHSVFGWFQAGCCTTAKYILSRVNVHLA